MSESIMGLNKLVEMGLGGVNSSIIDPSSFLGMVLRVLPSITAIGCFVIPGATALEIYRRRSTFNTPSLTFLSMATQCFVWLVYAFLISSMTLIVPNSVGLMLGILYIFVFHRYERKEFKDSLFRKYIVCILIILGVSLTALIASDETATKVIGLISAIGTIIFSFSPLAAIRTVIETKSTETMALHTSLILFFNGMCWVAYASLVRPDMAVFVPNIFGFLAGVLQLIAHCLYGPCLRHSSSITNTINDEEIAPLEAV